MRLRWAATGRDAGANVPADAPAGISSKPAKSGMAMEKITFGDNLPGEECGPKEGPAVLMIQVLR